MCDTFVALPGATTSGAVVFGKNSDREPDEAHELLIVPAADHDRDATVRCTHRTIPQARRTRTVLLARPYWIWGAEMGVNDRGLVIGNEALFNKGTREREPGLIGMDLLRLALERAEAAAEAVDVLTGLLEKYGQTGQAGHAHDFQYDNSFIAADAGEAWVLETMGRDWVARRVPDVASISNGLTTRTGWDRASAGVPAGTDVAARWSDPLITHFAAAGARQCRTSDALRSRPGGVSVRDAMAVLRSHDGGGPDWTPANALIGQDVCMHAGYGPVRTSQTTGSLVAEITPAGTTVWVTGTAAPCTSVFKPVWLDSGLPDLGPRPRGYFDPESLWWRHELLHRATLADYPGRHGAYAADLATVQEELVDQAPGPEASLRSRRAATEHAFAVAATAESAWYDRVSARPLPADFLDRVRQAPYRRAWRSFDRAARMPQPAEV